MTRITPHRETLNTSTEENRAFLPMPTRRADSSRQILLVERLPYEGLDHGLAADVQLFRGPVQFFQHAQCQVNIYPLDRTHHSSGIGEEPGHVFALVGNTGDGFCRHWFSLRSVLHKVSAPA